MELNINKTVTVCGVDIDIYDGPIGISASGGADSSLLLYILMKNHPGPIHIFTLAMDEKLRGTAFTAVDVIEKCIQLTKMENVIHHTFYKDVYSFSALYDLQDDYIKLGLYNLRYLGLTANPPYEVHSKFIGKINTYEERDPEITRSTGPHINNSYTPFTNIDKLVIRDMYNELGILDTVFPLTRSCESRVSSTRHCGICWWCQERKWAFGKL